MLVFERGLAESRQKAAALILAGKVLVEGSPVTKAGTAVDEGAEIALKEAEIPYVSRGALKLKEAAEHFNVDFTDKVVMDIGASTGGFTDYMLQHGAKRSYAVDVGYGQFHQKLRKDPRVVLLEKTNIRYLEREKIPEEIDLATIDVSFISLSKVLPKAAEFLKHGGEALALIKPQFEVGKGEVEKGGVVKDEAKRQRAIEAVGEAAREAGFTSAGVYQCATRGQKKGNIEYFIYLKRSTY